MLRWPASNIPSITKFGKDCPYAHHPMELQFPQSAKTRMAVNSKLIKQDKSTYQRHQKNFRYSGNLMECRDGCGRCNICLFKKQANEVLAEFKKKSQGKFNEQSVMEKK
jgi:hypothetical protein